MPTFIGSSTESKEIASRIADHLVANGHSVVKWWDRTTFTPSNYLLDELLELGTVCDSAVFVFGSDDRKWPRHHVRDGNLDIKYAEGEGIPRDNVILEYGIFSAKCGRDRVFVVTDPTEHPKMPSDMQGFLYVIDSEDTPEIISNRISTLERNVELPSTNEISIYTHKRSDLDGHLHPPRASAKIAYRGIRGAQAWAALERDPDYSGSRSTMHVADVIRSEAIADSLKACDHIISFGPGIGQNDCEVIGALHYRKLVQYIPVDINYHLALFAAHTIDHGNAFVRCIRAIVADFEEDVSFIAQVVREHAPGRRLFMMLGGTFGNIEKTEAIFFTNIGMLMDDTDYFVLDTFLIGPGYDAYQDPLTKVDEYPAAMQYFLANGIAQRENITVEEAVGNFHDLLDFDITPAQRRSNYSFDKVLLKSKPSGSTVMSVRRHELRKLKAIAKGSHLEVAAEKIMGTKLAGIQRGVFVFKKEAGSNRGLL